MKLSRRLQAILDLVPEDAILADIGTDHGLLIVKALLDKKVSYAYALDIAQKPLDSARSNVEHYGLQSQVSLELRNGLEGFQGDANCFVVAGMGAETILGIITNYSFSNEDVIILQSNTKIPFMRESLVSLGFQIIDEVFLVDKRIPTTIIKCTYKRSTSVLDDVDVWIGPVLRNKNELEHQTYLNHRMNHLERIKHHDALLNKEYTIIKTYLGNREA